MYVWWLTEDEFVWPTTGIDPVSRCRVDHVFRGRLMGGGIERGIVSGLALPRPMYIILHQIYQVQLTVNVR